MTLNGHMFGLFPMLEPEAALVPDWDAAPRAKAIDPATAQALGSSLSGSVGSLFNVAGELFFGNQRAQQQQQLLNLQLGAAAQAAEQERQARLQRTQLITKVVATIAVLAFIAFILYLLFR